MMNQETQNHTTHTNPETAYRRAARLQHASADVKKIARNTTLVPHWIEESDCFWYRQDTETGVQFRLVDAKALTNEPAFDHQALAAALSACAEQSVAADNLPIAKVVISFTPLQVRFVAFDQHFCFDAERQQCEPMTPSLDAGSLERLVSPDGKTIAFARDHNLWVQDVETGEERALTQDGEEDYAYAATSRIWGGPLNAYLQARWSPDSASLFIVRTDNRAVKRTAVVNFVPDEGVRPVVEEYPCGYPGDEQVETQHLLAIEVATGRQQAADYAPIATTRSGYGFFTDNLGWWGQDSRQVYFTDLARDYKRVRFVAFDTRTGKTRVLWEETSRTYLNLSPSEASPAMLLALPESQELVCYSERDGWGHLYLYDLDTGELKRPLTEGQWMVRELLHYDKDKRELYFQAGGRTAGRNPYYLDICRVNMDSGDIREVVAGDHEYSVLGSLPSLPLISFVISWSDPDWQSTVSGVSPNGDYVVATRSRVDEAPVNLLFDRDGRLLLELETAEAFGLPEQAHWPEPVSLLAADGETELYGVIYRPSGFSPDKHYPVIDCSMAVAEFAPSAKGSFTNAQHGGQFYLQAWALAELGFIVVSIDGRGTAYRHRDFVDASYGWVPLSNHAQDRIAGMKQLAQRYPSMDLERVGVMSFEGCVNGVYDMLEHPAFYKVGVSQALQDTRLMTSAWGEQYEELPSSAARHRPAEELVENLQGKLLLMHGLLDRMDHSAATWRVVDALQKANKDFDMLIFPTTEGQGAHIGSDYAFRRTWDYFVRHLLGEEPPREFDMDADTGS